MSQRKHHYSSACPCCDATLTIDRLLAAVSITSCRAAADGLELKDAARMVREEAGGAMKNSAVGRSGEKTNRSFGG